MTTSLILAFVWAIAANVIGMFPSKRGHWPAAWGLIAVGIPLLGYVTYENGPWIGLIALFAGVSVLRWPVRFAVRRVQRALRPERDGAPDV